MLFTCVHLFNKHFKSSKLYSLTSGYVRERLAYETPGNCLIWGSHLLTFISFFLFFLTDCFSLLCDSHRASLALAFGYLELSFAIYRTVIIFCLYVLHFK